MRVLLTGGAGFIGSVFVRYLVDEERVAKETFDSGIEKTVRWYLDNRECWELARRGVYAGERPGLGSKRERPLAAVTRDIK